MVSVFSDIRFAARLARRGPGVNLLAVLTLAIGCAASATVFTAVHVVLLKDLPVPQASRLVRLAIARKSDPAVRTAFSYPEFIAIRDRAQSLAGLAAVESFRAPVETDNGRRAIAGGELVSAGYFDVMGLGPSSGRAFTAAECAPAAAGDVAIVTDAFWRASLDRDPAIMGRVIRVSGVRFTIVGVMPAPFRGTNFASGRDILLPSGARERLRPDSATASRRWFDNADERPLQVLGRLARGAAAPALRAAIAPATRISSDGPPVLDGATVRVLPERAGLIAPDSPQSLTIVAVSVFILIAGTVLVVTMNLAAIFLARGLARQRELAIRRAIGARNGRIYRQLAAESAVVALPAIALAMLLTLWSGAIYRAFLPPMTMPLDVEFTPDAAVLLLTMACGLVAAFAATWLSARRILAEDVNAVLKAHAGGSPSGGRLFRGLIAVQFAVSGIAFVGAGLIVKSLANYQRVDTGVDVVHTLVAPVELTGSPAVRSAARNRMLDAVRSLPGIRSVAFATQLPLSPSGGHINLRSGDGGERSVGINYVGAAYFGTMRIALRQGRLLDSTDEARGDVAAVSETFAREMGGSVIGRSLQFTTGSRAVTVVGVVNDVRYECLACPPGDYVYLPLASAPPSRVFLHASVDGDPAMAINAVRQVLIPYSGGLQVPDVHPVSNAVAADLWLSRTSALTLTGMALIIGALAAVGLYGLTAFRISRSLRTLAVRVALGARPSHVLRIVAGEGLRATALGGALGLLAGYGVAVLLASVLLGVSAADPSIYAIAIGLMGLVVFFAIVMPARRALHTDIVAQLKDG